MNFKIFLKNIYYKSLIFPTIVLIILLSSYGSNTSGQEFIVLPLIIIPMFIYDIIFNISIQASFTTRAGWLFKPTFGFLLFTFLFYYLITYFYYYLKGKKYKKILWIIVILLIAISLFFLIFILSALSGG